MCQCRSHNSTQSHSNVLTALVQFKLTLPLVIDDVFAEKIVVAENYRGAQQRQALLEPQQLFSEALQAGNLQTKPEGGQKVQQSEYSEKKSVQLVGNPEVELKTGERMKEETENKRKHRS